MTVPKLTADEPITRQEVSLVPVKVPPKELSDHIQYQCEFCEKRVTLAPRYRRICETLSGRKFYCGFCLSNNYHTRLNRDILPMSFRGIIGYYYHFLYKDATNRKMWYSQIRDYMDHHRFVGSLNPVFKYDEETMMWFVDFSKIGKGRKKIKLTDVLDTVNDIIEVFELNSHVPSVQDTKFYSKFEEAITKFYSKRYRPADKRLLVPTLSKCMYTVPNKGIEATRDFSKAKLIPS